MSNWIYVNDCENANRYVLGEKGERILFCIGINPSVAEPDKLDPTLKKVKAIASYNGYSGWIMLNVYPERKTVFKELPDCGDKVIHSKNLKHISKIIDTYSEIDVWIAFGNHIYDRAYFKNYLSDIYGLFSKRKVNWYAVGVNKTGAPRHPLYQKTKTRLENFRMDDFINSLK